MKENKVIIQHLCSFNQYIINYINFKIDFYKLLGKKISKKSSTENKKKALKEIDYTKFMGLPKRQVTNNNLNLIFLPFSFIYVNFII